MSRLQGRVVVLGAVLAAAGCEYMGYDLTGGGYVVTFRQGALEWQALPPFLERDLEDSKTYCSELELLGSGWRIPTPEELYGLYLARKDFPSVPGLEDGEYWSASGATGTKIDFEDGEVFEWSYIFSSTYRVRCVRAAPVDEGGGTFRQPSTGLVWQREPAPQGMEWRAAERYCFELELQGNGWRLPTKEELEGLYGEKEEFLTVPGLDSGWYWSSSLYEDGVGSAWSVDFDYGRTSYGTILYSYRVRCVRAPPVHEEGGTFYQSSIGRTWQREPASSAMTWDNANNYCADLSLAGGNWRLPTKEELQYLWDEREFFWEIPGMVSGGYYWSSLGDGSTAWAVGFNDEDQGYVGTYNNLGVRCVR